MSPERLPKAVTLRGFTEAVADLNRRHTSAEATEASPKVMLSQEGFL